MRPLIVFQTLATVFVFAAGASLQSVENKLNAKSKTLEYSLKHIESCISEYNSCKFIRLKFVGLPTYVPVTGLPVRVANRVMYTDKNGLIIRELSFPEYIKYSTTDSLVSWEVIMPNHTRMTGSGVIPMNGDIVVIRAQLRDHR